MGCDIHGHLEIKVKGVWHHYHTPDIKRNYTLFGKLAGVRDKQIKPICKPKGIPEDISVGTRVDLNRMEGDAHTHSWLDSIQLGEIIEWHKEQYPEGYFRIYDEWGFICGNGWESFNKYRNDYPEEIEDIRFVFWFDN
jgi:hypothetical protein